ncbi:MAG: ATP-binding cassette domain-containing protein [Blautia sp.]|nr:ATP-binding cassette domain-containing protein [Blautia sp.]
MAPSGAGKTTLLNLLNRTVPADAGTIEGVPERIGMVFQEDRLCGEYDAAANIMLASRHTAGGGRKDRAREKRYILSEASEILPEECLHKPVKELSGGMKRRCAVLRAVLSGAELIVMDEPFTGLDEETRKRTAAYILKKLDGRTLLVATHRAEDAELLQGELITLKQAEEPASPALSWKIRRKSNV